MQSRWVFMILALCLASCSTTTAPPATPIGGAVATATQEAARGLTATPESFAQSLAAFEVELEAVRQGLKIPGMSAAIVKNGELIWAHGFGYADIEKQIPATPDTPYELASVTKTSAAVAVMQLVQDGKLSLDDPVSRLRVLPARLCAGPGQWSRAPGLDPVWHVLHRKEEVG